MASSSNGSVTTGYGLVTKRRVLKWLQKFGQKRQGYCRQPPQKRPFVGYPGPSNNPHQLSGTALPWGETTDLWVTPQPLLLYGEHARANELLLGDVALRTEQRGL